MIYGFDTADEAAATGALLVYAIYRSRDRRRYKTTPDMWGQIERFVTAAAKRARTLPQFVQALKPRLCCDAINPRWTAVGHAAQVPLLVRRDAETGALKDILQIGGDGRREFLTQIFERADARSVVRLLYRETAWTIMLVRDRLEREMPIEAQLETLDTEETANA